MYKLSITKNISGVAEETVDPRPPQKKFKIN